MNKLIHDYKHKFKKIAMFLVSTAILKLIKCCGIYTRDI